MRVIIVSFVIIQFASAMSYMEAFGMFPVSLCFRRLHRQHNYRTFPSLQKALLASTGLCPPGPTVPLQELHPGETLKEEYPGGSSCLPHSSRCSESRPKGIQAENPDVELALCLCSPSMR